MSSFVRGVRRFMRHEEGATAVEYAVMLALIVLACLTAVITLGQTASSSFTDSQNQMNAAMGGGAGGGGTGGGGTGGGGTGGGGTGGGGTGS